jgi:hypothetical protein
MPWLFWTSLIWGCWPQGPPREAQLHSVLSNSNSRGDPCEKSFSVSGWGKQKEEELWKCQGDPRMERKCEGRNRDWESPSCKTRSHAVRVQAWWQGSDTEGLSFVIEWDLRSCVSVHETCFHKLVMGEFLFSVCMSWMSCGLVCFDWKLDLPLLSYVSPDDVWRNAVRTFPFLAISVIFPSLYNQYEGWDKTDDGSVVPFWAQITWFRDENSGPARSLGESTCSQAWWPEFNPRTHLVQSRKWLLRLSPDFHVPTVAHICVYTHVYIHTYTHSQSHSH